MIMNATDLLVTAEDVQTGKRLIGYVCCCKDCQRRLFESMDGIDENRPIGLLTHPDLEYGNVTVYTDNMEFVNK